MKKILFVLFITCAAPILASAQTTQTETTNTLANVATEDGYLLFMYSAPVKSYSTLGYLKKARIVWSGKPKEMFKLMIRKVKKQFPQADAIIVESVDMNEVRAIKFDD